MQPTWSQLYTFLRGRRIGYDGFAVGHRECHASDPGYLRSGPRIRLRLGFSRWSCIPEHRKLERLNQEVVMPTDSERTKFNLWVLKNLNNASTLADKTYWKAMFV